MTAIHYQLNQRFWLLVITVAMAACSLVYQLVIAQTLTVLFGGTVLRDSITIGLYLFGMGLGAFYADRWPTRQVPRKFFYTQISLSLMGSLGFITMIIVSAWQYKFPWLVYLYSYALTLGIGFLSGLELPLMNELNQNRFTQTLSFDYWGALLGSVSFPLLLYPQFGLIVSALLTACVNWLICVYIAYHFRLSWWLQGILWITGSILMALTAYQNSLEAILQNIYVTGKLHAN